MKRTEYGKQSPWSRTPPPKTHTHISILSFLENPKARVKPLAFQEEGLVSLEKHEHGQGRKAGGSRLWGRHWAFL